MDTNNDNPAPTPEVRVSQSDRDAAAAWLEAHDRGAGVLRIQRIRSGDRDDHPLVQAFARHRINHALAPDADRVRQALETLTKVGDRLCNAVERMEQDIGGESVRAVLGDLGPAVDAAQAVLAAALAPTPPAAPVRERADMVRLARETASALERTAEEAEDNDWDQWGATMRQAAKRMRGLIAALSGSAPPEAGREGMIDMVLVPRHVAEQLDREASHAAAMAGAAPALGDAVRAFRSALYGQAPGNVRG